VFVVLWRCGCELLIGVGTRLLQVLGAWRGESRVRSLMLLLSKVELPSLFFPIIFDVSSIKYSAQTGA
jgi:hypothetical protein